MQVRVFNFQRDYWDICAWWLEQGWPPVPPEYLSSYGMVAMDDSSKLAAAGWLYIANSQFCFIEYLVSNPHSPMKQRPKALKCLIEALCIEAKGFGAIRTASFFTSPGLIRLTKKLGYLEADKSLTCMVRDL